MSISVNVWTDSQQSELVEKIFSLPLPLDYRELDGTPHNKHEHAQWRDAQERRIAVAVLIYRLLEHVCKHRGCRDGDTDAFLDAKSGAEHKDAPNYFVHQLWSTRYRALMENDELPDTFHEDGHILCEGPDSQQALSASLSIAKDIHYGTYLEQVAQLVRGLPVDTWELWMGNYVEYLAASAVEEVEYVGLFLRHFSSCTDNL